MNTQTLEQKRAEHTWQVCECYKKDEVNAAKSLPALIMNSGLMQVMAFAHEKEGHNKRVATDLRLWLAKRFPSQLQIEFDDFMTGLMRAGPREYQAINNEAFAWLKWLRQMAAARLGDSENG